MKIYGIFTRTRGTFAFLSNVELKYRIRPCKPPGRLASKCAKVVGGGFLIYMIVYSNIFEGVR